MPNSGAIATFSEEGYDAIEMCIEKILDEYNADVISELIAIKLITHIFAAIDMRSALKNDAISDPEILQVDEPLMINSAIVTKLDRQDREVFLRTVVNKHKSGVMTRFAAARTITTAIEAIDRGYYDDAKM